MINGIINGVTSYFKALQLTVKYNLWGYFFAPTLISMLLGGLIIGGAWNSYDNIGTWLIQYYPFEWGKTVIEKIIGVFGGLIIVILGLILFKHLVLALSSPFMSMLSEKVERKITGIKESPAFSVGKFLSDLVRGITIAIRNIIYELLITLLLLFLLGLIPVLTPFTTVLIFVVQAFYAGFGNMDFALERYYNVRESVRFVRQNRGLAIGNGAAFLFLFFTLVGFVFALPLGTIAATSETIKRL